MRGGARVARSGGARLPGARGAAAALAVAAALALLVAAAGPAGARAAALGCSATKDTGFPLGPEEFESELDAAAIAADGFGATCWQPDCSVPFPNKRCKTVGRRYLECRSLLDAGVAHATRAECCRASFGDAGCGRYCYVRDAAAPPPNRQCARVDDLAECDRQYDAGGAHATAADCCQTLFGAAGCGSFPDKCYMADGLNEGRCAELAPAAACAEAMDGRRAWRERGECCKANGFVAPACREQAACWVADESRRPHRACARVSADDCPQRRDAGAAWDSREACCASAFGPGRGCREFPSACVALAPGARPRDACGVVGSAAACAAGLDARPPAAFESRADCCAAALPGVPVDAAASEASGGCAYSPEACWVPPGSPEPGVDECVEVREADRCRRDVAAGAGAWATRAACCAALYGKLGCRRYPDSCWVAAGAAPDRECRQVVGAAACAAAAGGGALLFPSQRECCETAYGALGCRTYPDRCFARRASHANPDRTCLAIDGKAACAKELDGRTGAATQEACCRGFKGGCVTYPTTCYAPVVLEELLPARVCRAIDEPVKCKWDVANGNSHATLAGCCKAHNCTLPARCWVGDAGGSGCTFVANDADRCRDGALTGQAFSSRPACECALFQRGCAPAQCWVKDGNPGAKHGLPGGCRQEKNAGTCASAVALQMAAATREECCVQNFDFGRSACGTGCWFNPNRVAPPPPPQGVPSPPMPRSCVQVTTDPGFCAKHWATGAAWLSQPECCSSSYPGQGCRTFPASCWVQANENGKSPDRRCTFQDLGPLKCGTGIVGGTAWESEQECCAGAFGAEGCKTFPTSCYGPEPQEETLPARLCRAISDPAVCKWDVFHGKKHETFPACCAVHGCTLGTARCWAAGPDGKSCAFVVDNKGRCRDGALSGLAFANRAACECALFKRGCSLPTCWVRDGPPGSWQEPGSCRAEYNAAACAKAMERQAAAATREECCIQHFDFRRSGCGTGCWVNPEKAVLPVLVAGPRRERQCIQVTTDPGFCAKHWATGAAWLSQPECCSSSYPGQGCRTYPASCWVPAAEDDTHEAPAQTCRLKLLGATVCSSRIDGATAWGSEAACCAGAYGGKGCAPQPEACWTRGPTEPTRACILHQNSSFCVPATASGGAFLNETACCAAHGCGPAAITPLQALLPAISPVPCWLKLGLGCALHPHSLLARDEAGPAAAAGAAATRSGPEADGLEEDEAAAPLGACWVRDPTAKASSPDRRCALQALPAGECEQRLENRTAWASKAACCGATFGPQGCRTYPHSCWVPGPLKPSRVCRQRKDAPRVCPQAIAKGKAFETEAACCHAHRCTKLSAAPCWVPLPAPAPWVPQTAAERCVLSRDAARCRAPGGRGAATATKALCMCANFREGCGEAQY